MVDTWKRIIIFWLFLWQSRASVTQHPQFLWTPKERLSDTLDHSESQLSSRAISGAPVGPVRNWRESATHP